ncbi:hypothetical protein AAG906_014960 [Vitis piasezkii]
MKSCVPKCHQQASLKVDNHKAGEQLQDRLTRYLSPGTQSAAGRKHRLYPSINEEEAQQKVTFIKCDACLIGTSEARIGPSTAAIVLEWPSYSLRQQQAGAPADQVPPGSVSQQLDDMLSTPFDPHIIIYEPSRGFILPKFMTYDETRNPFDHIMHFRQLMTFDIGNDTLLCKVFLANLHNQALS